MFIPLERSLQLKSIFLSIYLCGWGQGRGVRTSHFLWFCLFVLFVLQNIMQYCQISPSSHHLGNPPSHPLVTSRTSHRLPFPFTSGFLSPHPPPPQPTHTHTYSLFDSYTFALLYSHPHLTIISSISKNMKLKSRSMKNKQISLTRL